MSKHPKTRVGKQGRASHSGRATKETAANAPATGKKGQKPDAAVTSGDGKRKCRVSPEDWDDDEDEDDIDEEDDEEEEEDQGFTSVGAGPDEKGDCRPQRPKKKRGRKGKRGQDPSRNGQHDPTGAGRPRDEDAHEANFRRRDPILPRPDDPEFINPGPQPRPGRKKHNDAFLLWHGYRRWIKLALQDRVESGKKPYRNNQLTDLLILTCEIVWWLRPSTHEYVKNENIGKPKADAIYRHRTSEGKWWITTRPTAWAKKYDWPNRRFAQRLIDRLVELGVAELCPLVVDKKFGPNTKLIRIRVERCPRQYNPDWPSDGA
jgi:hypothetical protein